MIRAFGNLCMILLCFGCVPGGSSGGGEEPDDDAAVQTDADVCTPDCTDRLCGDDGCGGVCGACADGEICTAAGACFEVPATCGDDACSAADGETCETCPADCGACCSDGVCTAGHGEDCSTCPADCGCPDGETCGAGGLCDAACVPDCNMRLCGDDGCGGSCGGCPDDEVCAAGGVCIAPPDSCGDAACDPGEDCANCIADCPCEAGQNCADGQCVDAPRCGDDTCDPGEDCDTCAADCACGPGQDCRAGLCTDAPRCGDGACDPDEDCAQCAADCACAPGLDCVNAECVCVPRCGGAVCGDDGCGGTCGDCPDGAACAGGECVFECPDDCGAPWVATCTADGFGLRLCAPDAGRPGCTTPSRRIPCGEDRACGDGACGGVCVKPEVILLVDRSSSMLGERWQFTRDTLVGNASDRADLARLGLRTFPAQGDGCGAGDVTAPAFRADAFQRMPDPAQVAQTPIAAAFEGVEDVFGDPDEGETVILITDGDETCDEELAAVTRVEALRRRGIRTFAVGISRQANGELLAAIAEAGGTARDAGTSYYVVDDARELRAALDDIFERLETCVCNQGDRRCDGDTRQICAADGFAFEVEDDCAFGCNPASAECHPICNPADESVTCDGDLVKRCNATGDGFDVPRLCRLGCRPGGECNPQCRPGQRRCVGAVSQQCNAAGDGFDPIENCDPCDVGTGLCGEPDRCAPLRDFRCGDAGVEICRADGLGFAPYTTCECDPNTARCRGVPAEAQVRLVGDVPESGRLEIWHAGEWGTICDDSFGAGEATVGCQQLGYPAVSQQYNDTGAGRIWLDDLACIGTEPTFAECGFDDWGREDCGHNEDVGLACRLPEPGEAWCDDEETSYALVEPGVVRFQPCVEGCAGNTGLCNEQIPDLEAIPLPAEECYAHHGGCAEWNECVDAAGCANIACAIFGHGAAVSWTETASCVSAGQTCRPYSPARQSFDADFNGCQLPAACDVVCQPR